MEELLRRWESSMQDDPALKDRLHRLNPEGYPATIRGDLLCLRVKSDPKPIVVNWDGNEIHVVKRPAKKPFLSWSIDKSKFKELFLTGKNPPVLVAMNNDQKNIEACSDHHNGALVLSFMVMLQECMEGGGK